MIIPDRHGTGTNGLLLTPARCASSRASGPTAARATARSRSPPACPAALSALAVAAARHRHGRGPRWRCASAWPARPAGAAHARRARPGRTRGRALGHEPRADAGRAVAELSARALARPSRGARGRRSGGADRGRRWGAICATGGCVAIAHKVVSKSEGAIVELADVTPRPPRARARRQTRARTRASWRWCSSESAEVLRAERDVLVCRTRHGFVCANAGVDASNASADGRDSCVLPRDPDGSARRIRARLRDLTGLGAGGADQ